MNTWRPRILIAAPAAVIRELHRALGKDVEVTGAQTWEQALEAMTGEPPSLAVICYAFDEMRPFRLLRYLRHEWRGAKMPVILVRALPVAMGRTQEAEIRDSYQSLGVDDFINLYDTAQRTGTPAALARFRELVLARLPRASFFDRSA